MKICIHPGPMCPLPLDNFSQISASSVLLSKTMIQNSQMPYVSPFSISFQGSRNYPIPHPKITETYNKIIRGQAGELLVSNPNRCLPNHVSGNCGDYRDNLTECRCEALNRKKFPIRREVFENEVIRKALTIIANDGSNFYFHLALFACGGLHGEEVLLFRLINELKNSGYQGTIRISLIDTTYKTAIEESAKTRKLGSQFNWDLLIGNRKDLKQFLQELTLILPPGIILEGSCFGSSEDYIQHSKFSSRYLHHLLAGADIENTVEHIVVINKQACITREPPIVLLKKAVLTNGIPQERPEICFLFQYEQPKCYQLFDAVINTK
jgi:hypothetical protein